MTWTQTLETGGTQQLHVIENNNPAFDADPAAKYKDITTVLRINEGESQQEMTHLESLRLYEALIDKGRITLEEQISVTIAYVLKKHTLQPCKENLIVLKLLECARDVQHLRADRIAVARAGGSMRAELERREQVKEPAT